MLGLKAYSTTLALICKNELVYLNELSNLFKSDVLTGGGGWERGIIHSSPAVIFFKNHLTIYKKVVRWHTILLTVGLEFEACVGGFLAVSRSDWASQ